MIKAKTKVIHSETKAAWNVVNTVPGQKYKIARVPYPVCGDEETAKQERIDALKIARYISDCINNYEEQL